MTSALTYIRNGLGARMRDWIVLPVSSFLSGFEPPLSIPQSYEKLQAIYPDNGGTCLAPDSGVPDDREDYPYDVQVVIPVYNPASTLRQAIDSALNQTGGLRILVTVVNDGSTDGSAGILKKYESIDNVDVITQSNKGLSGARNAALRQIRGRYVTFLDSDDYLPENALMSLFGMAEQTSCDIVQGSYICAGESMKEVSVPTLTENGVMLGFPWGKLLKARFFRQFRFPDGYWFEDTLMGLVIFALTPPGKRASVSTPAYCYRDNPGGITNTARRSPKVIDSVYITRRLYEDRVTIGMPPSRDEYLTFLRQTVINLKRVRSYGDRDMLRLAFCVMRDLRDRYFPDAPEPAGRPGYLHRALTAGKFNQCVRLIDMV